MVGKRSSNNARTLWSRTSEMDERRPLRFMQLHLIREIGQVKSSRAGTMECYGVDPDQIVTRRDKKEALVTDLEPRRQKRASLKIYKMFRKTLRRRNRTMIVRFSAITRAKPHISR